MIPPLVSIVTPTYNQASFVGETIESVLGQTYPHIEYIVLDDGSTDETPEVLKRYREASPNIRIERHENMGQTATINKGWDASHGDIIAWLNSDDLLTPDAVTQAVEALEAHPKALVVYGNCDYVSAEGDFQGPFPCRQETLESLLFYEQSIGIAQPSSFLRREVLYGIGFLDPLIYWCMDFDYWLRVNLNGEMAYIDGPAWSKYRLHPEAKGTAQRARSAPDFVYVYRKLASYGDLPPPLQGRRREIIAHGHWIAARRFMYDAKRERARREAWTSFRMAPTRHLKSKMKLILGRP